MNPITVPGSLVRSAAHPTRAGLAHAPLPQASPATPALNTILAVREHAPNEIDELEAEILSLHQRLGAAYARKRLLEQLLHVIQQADAVAPPTHTGMAVLR